MVKVTVLRPFKDLKARKNRFAGDVFEATEERAAYIDAALPGYVSYESAPKPDVAGETLPVAADETKAVEDLSKMTVPQLKAVAAERGVEVPKRAKKAEIVEMLQE